MEPPRTAAEKNKEKSSKAEIIDEQGKDDKTSMNINVDATMLYGQFNSLFWSGSILQNFEKFTYQLNSKFSYSNDFGYKNTRYYDNEIGFTGVADVTTTWKLTPEITVNNASHGMFRNPYYYSEDKDKVYLMFRNEYRQQPTRWDINVGGIYFTHRLDSSLFPMIDTVQPYHSSDFYKGTAELGWEYIWSAANKLRFDSKFSQYFYSTGADNDTAVANQLIWNFNISEYFKFGLGPLYTYNRDRGNFVSGKIDAATANLKYVAVSASYVYELVPFTPENYYFDQKFVRPYYSLRPGEGHRAELSLGIDYAASGKGNFYVKKVKVKASGTYTTNDRYYSYFSLPQLILAPHQMKVMQCRAKAEIGIGFAIYSSYLEFGGKYEYTYSYASGYVTYQPEHLASGYLHLAVHRFEFQFSTGFRSNIYASPFINLTIAQSLTGSFTLQFKVLGSFYLYGRIDNIYDSKYSTVYGYPEPGRTFMGGLRIMI